MNLEDLLLNTTVQDSMHIYMTKVQSHNEKIMYLIRQNIQVKFNLNDEEFKQIYSRYVDNYIAGQYKRHDL